MEFKGSDNFTAEWIRVRIGRDMKDCFHLIFASENPVEKVNIKAYMELMDRHGNIFDELVYDATMVRRTAPKNKLAKQAPVKSE